MAIPKKETELTRSHHITLRLTNAQYNTINEAAKKANISRSAYICQQLLKNDQYNTYQNSREQQKLKTVCSNVDMIFETNLIANRNGKKI